LGVIVGEHHHRRPTVWRPSTAFQPQGSSATVTPDKRQGDTQLAPQRRTASPTATHQLTEGSFRPKGRKRTEGAGARSARAPLAPPPEAVDYRYGPPPGVVPQIFVTES
jgi:hypothetical protein